MLLPCHLVQDEEQRKQEVTEMQASLDQLRIANQERQQKQQAAQARLATLQVQPQDF